jgi:DNA topoisomerase-1
VSVRIGATTADGRDAEFSTSGTVITFRGFLAAYEEGRDEENKGEADAADTERRLPSLKTGDDLTLLELAADGHSTSPPARYTEATLIKALEERGIGRPSTFDSTLKVINERGYVFKKGTALAPSWIAFSVISLLEKHFGSLVDYDFTAQMEDDLDRIANGEQDRVAWLRRFYFGDGEGVGLQAADVAHGGLRQLVESLGDIDARDVNSIPIGNDIVLRVGRYGPYVERAGNPEDRASVPEDMAPDELTVERAEELLAEPSGDRDLGVDPSTGRPVVAKSGRYGAYVTEVLPDDAPKSARPRTGSLFKTMTLDTVTLDQALRLLSLPRVVGVDPGSGEEITAQNGRYGPYVQKGKETRSLESEEQLFATTLEQALELLSKPKERRGRGKAAAGPLRELGPDPLSGKPIVIRSGRFGPYATDGETNASLRRGDDPETVTLERAIELMAERRAKGPVERRKRS